MEYRRTRLDSGIEVVTEHMPSVRSVAIGFWLGVGSRDETTQQSGCSHFLEHLLFKGTSRRTARQIAEELDAVGGEMNAFTSKEYTCFYARVLDTDVRLAVDVLGDMLRDASNTPQDVDAERQVVLEEINIHLDSPDDLVHSDFAEAVFGDHPLAFETLGSSESISDMPRDVIHGYYQDHYRPETLTVAAAGRVDHDELVGLVEELVGDLDRPGGARPERHAPALDASRGSAHERVHVRHRPTEQAHVLLGGVGLPQEDERRSTMWVLNTLLGGGMSSRLFQEIREIRGLAYTTYSYAGSHTDAGMYGAYAGTTPAKVDELLKVLRDELDGVVDSVSADEVDRAKGNLAGGIVLGLEDPGSRMVRIGRLAATGAELISVDELLRQIDAVDLDAVRALGRDLLLAPRTLAVVGPFEEDADRFATYVA